MKNLRYPFLLLVVLLFPTWLATIVSSLAGYIVGYLLIYAVMKLINKILNKEVYPKRIRTTYLIINAIVALLLWGVLTGSIALLYAGQPLNLNEVILFIGWPWVSVQLLLLFFFVQSDNMLK